MICTVNLNPSAPNKLICIGASTGGPMQIQRIVTALPVLHNTTIIIAQHMARGFIPSFIKRLKEHSANPIQKAEDGEELRSEQIYICIGYTELLKKEHAYRFIQSPSPEHTFNPDINLVFKSILPFVEDFNLLSVILTGIGEDGVEGCRLLTEAGGRAITESAQSAIVDGMPSRARQCVSNIKVLDMDAILKEIVEFCQ